MWGIVFRPLDFEYCLNIWLQYDCFNVLKEVSYDEILEALSSNEFEKCHIYVMTKLKFQHQSYF